MSEESYGAKFKLQRDIERESLQAAINHFNIDLNASELAQSLLDYRSHPQLFPESKGVLAGLDIPVCLLTNIDNAEIRTALQYTGLKFTFVVTSEGLPGLQAPAGSFPQSFIPGRKTAV